MKTIPATAPEHWRGLLHLVPHSRALLIRDATGARFPLTPEDCRFKQAGSAQRKAMSFRLWRRDQRYGYALCYWCSAALTRQQVTKDHVRARCFGGSDSLDNLVPACEPCNHRRSLEQSRIMDQLWVEWTIAELRLAA